MSRELERPRQLSLYTGPETGDQLAALGSLKALAGRQAEEALAWGLPELSPYTGPNTGDQLNLLEALADDYQKKPSAGKRFKASRWLLPGILAAQAGLSLRLVWSNTAFPDEALYLWAGHLEWEHWLHGTPLPAFPTYFSGAPAVYPPIGALADVAGGLAGARLLSLGFMLGATALLYGVTARLFTRQAGWLAAAMFATLAATQYLGAFATYDAMALFLLAAATWLGVAAVHRSGFPAVLLTLSSALTLVTADVAKYAAALFTPTVLLTVTAVAWWRSARMRVPLTLTGGYAVVLAGALAVGGKQYWQGITYTTLARTHDTASPQFLLFVSAKWEGALLLLAIVGAVVLIRHRSRPAKLLALVLAAAPFLVPVEQARIDTYTSLFKHISYGAWFGAVLAGYALSSLPWAVPAAKIARAWQVAAATVVLAAIPAVFWAASHFGWPDTSAIIPEMQRVISSTGGPILADDRGNILDYYLPRQISSRQIDGTFFFSFNDPESGQHLSQGPAYAAAVKERYFGVIFLEFWDSAPQDEEILADIRKFGSYRLVAKIPYRATGAHGDAMIWVRDRSAR